MKQSGKYILIGIILLIIGGIYTLNADRSAYTVETVELIPIEEEMQETLPQSPQDNRPVSPRDTLPPRYPVAKVIPDEYKDLDRKYPIDLQNPENFDSDFEYDPASNTYRIKSKIGDIDVTTPFSLTPDEYMEYSFKRSMDSYFRKKYEDSFAKQGKDSSVLSMFDFKFDLGPAEKLFGPGGVQLKAEGSVNVKMAMTRTTSGDPTRTANQRSRTAFDFDSRVQTNVEAKVGDKINFDLNYNTETTFDFDTKKLKLGYQGKEDEILKVLEAGNVSMNTTNSLIRGGAALFGIKTQLQFGKLTVDAIFSQQESQSKTISSKGTAQTTPFEIKADAYDENRHFFMAYYHRDKYDDALETLPMINSGIKIERVEVWITNKRADYNEARNIVAFSDMGEHDSISNKQFVAKSGNSSLPYNNANTLYSTITSPQYSGLRDKSKVNQIFEKTSMIAGRDYEKIESARRLSPSEYILNKELGYISLAGMMLQPDEVLAVAYEYKYKGETYQVGEFSNDKPDNTKDNLYVKLLKGTAMSPGAPFWDLMMKNVYSLNATSIQADKFRLNIKYQNDTTGVYINYIPEGDIANQLLIRVMNLDRLDAKGDPYPDGYFDFWEGYTVLAQSGKIIFPVVEPFGSYLRKKINSNNDPIKDTIANKYVFQELYDSTMTVAKQIAEKNKFIMQGEYKGSAASDINLGGNNIANGSVRVTANGIPLKENVDYTVDYTSGNVTIINPQYENANIQISSENRSNFGMQRKTMMGLNLNYAINPKFNIGATVMNLSEMPITMKVNLGEESINNTLYGFNTNYTANSQWLTSMLDKLPLLNLTQASTISFNGEFAHLIPGHYKSKIAGDYSYIDDFEKAKQSLDLRSPYSWNLSSTPAGDLFEEAKYMNNVDYGKNRALLAWYYIDGLFTRPSSLTPTHIKNDKDQLSNHYVREVQQRELFPNKEDVYAEASTLPVFNMAFYPNERGPYNLDATRINPNGTLTNPKDRWGGITRKIESSFIDFEAANVEYIEFWLLDPFIYKPNSQGGDFYINLGEVSEDVLKDGKKFFEQGLPINREDTGAVDTTVWGKVPKNQSLVTAFDNTAGARAIQDVGLNGLSKEEEKIYPSYADFLTKLMDNLDDDTKAKMADDPFSPLNSPSGDIYHYFRGSDYDDQQTTILDRYKWYNGTEGNSADAGTTNEKYNTAAKLTPDVEDINQDNTLNETEKYYQYKVSIRPQDLVVGQNYITEKKEAAVTLKNGSTETVNWYQFKIPVKGDSKNIGDIKDFRTIRFMRMFMTNFSDTTILRFGTLELVKGDWRNYTQSLSNPNLPPSGNANVTLSTVNIEENSRKEPVNYVLPPGVSRILDPSQPQLRQQNEQALSVKITDLAPGDARAIYKNTGLDTRQYKRLQMFAHAEKLIDDVTDLQNDELSIFIRLGSDYKNNYYEYEIPMKLTPPGKYSGEINSDQETVWPKANMFDFPFEILTDLKLERNQEKRKAGSHVSYGTPYSNMDPKNPLNKITVIGNPSISEIKVIMIGVRNNSRSTKSTEVWVNELRLTEFNEDGGWAAKANLFVALSDLGSLNFSGQKETTGFGSLDQGIMDRNLDDHQQYSVNTTVEAGKFFPEKAKVSIPFHYSYSEEVVNPKYNPLDQDILLKDALNAVDSKAEKDSIKSFSQQKVSNKSIGVNNLRVDVKSKNPMPYDPANFSLGYMYTENFKQDATTTYDRNTVTRATFAYIYSPFIKPLEPFKSIKSKAGSVKFLKDFGLNYLPNEFSITSDINRTYYEVQLRDLNVDQGSMSQLDASFREDFYWNRAGSIQWNLTKNLNATFNTGTKARIDAPHVQVNKQFNKDEYEQWKEAVWKSIQDLGTPLNYDQDLTVSYNIPFRSIPILDFITATATYTGAYHWEKGATLKNEAYELGNTIRNERTIGISNLSMGFTSLYNKSHFLNEANKKFNMKRIPSQSSTTTKRNSQTNKKPLAGTGASADSTKTNKKEPVKKPEKKKFESEVQLNPDSVTVVQHQLDNKRVRVTARGENGRLYEVKFKAIDKNSIRINNKDTSRLKLTVSQLAPLEETTWYKTAQVAARGLMMVRSARFSYNLTNTSAIPNFNPNIGDFFGQGNTPFGNAPGLDFAFGFTDEGYVNTADSRGWLIKTSNFITPAIFSEIETFTFGASLEPFTGFRVDLTANRSSTSGTEIEFMNEGSPKQFYGSFNMTTIAIGSSFEKRDPKNNYRSKVFEKFQANRQTIYNRLENAYNRTTYPDAGFIAGKPIAGKEFMPFRGDLTLNSNDVLIPAFIAAYTGKDASNVGLSAFPSLKQLLPNWRITYEGFMQLDLINKHFKSFILSHEYNCRYIVGNYTSYASWVATPENDGLGFIKSLTDSPIPSSPYEISAASLMEAFNPLIGLNATFRNNMTMKMEMKSTRNVNMNVSSYQLVEGTSNDAVIGVGYILTQFNKVLKMKASGGENFSNDLKISADISFQKRNSLIRKIQDGFTQATGGESNIGIKLSADYSLSKALTLQAFYDRLINKPLISSTAYPTTKSSFGINIRLSLMR